MYIYTHKHTLNTHILYILNKYINIYIYIYIFHPSFSANVIIFEVSYLWREYSLSFLNLFYQSLSLTIVSQPFALNVITEL